MWVVLFLLLASVCILGTVQGDYVGAVAEHTIFMGADGDSPQYLLDKNLQMYEQLTNLAGANGVQVLVFPEFGLTPTDKNERSNLYPFAERIPEVQRIHQVPCSDPKFQELPILARMSCAAQKNNLVVLVNMVDWVECDSATDANCPSDNHYQYNTDVLFDESGALVAKYHKSHEFPTFLPTYDVPAKPSQVTYKSKFGVEFGLFICFDIMFENPAKILIARGVRHFLYAVSQGSLGENLIIQPWSKRNEVTVLSANLGSGKKDCAGLIVNGTALPANKYHLTDNEFKYENILVATVPV